MNIKNHAKAKWLTFLTLIVAVVAVFIGKEVGTSGGEIRHSEIRENTVENAIEKQNLKINRTND